MCEVGLNFGALMRFGPTLHSKHDAKHAKWAPTRMVRVGAKRGGHATTRIPPRLNSAVYPAARGAGTPCFTW